jgi:hypothetical protein
LRKCTTTYRVSKPAKPNAGAVFGSIQAQNHPHYFTKTHKYFIAYKRIEEQRRMRAQLKTTER